MKTLFAGKWQITAAVIAVLLFTSCKKEEIKPAATTDNASTELRGPLKITSSSIIHLPGLVADDAGNLNPNIHYLSPIYNSVDHSPITDTYGNTITYEQFMAVAGQATVKCVSSGTNFTVNMSHLIPKGVYTLWVQIFKAPGFDGTFNNMIGYGRADGHNNFRASNSGTAMLSVTLPPGPMSMTPWYNVDDCLISSGLEFHLIGVYQTNGETYGWTPGREGIFVEQFRFVFNK